MPEQISTREAAGTVHIVHADLLTEKQAANFLGLSPATLQAWRTTGRVRLEYRKIGRAVRYRLEDLKNFVDSSRRSTTAS
ncbi:MAG: DNA-binding protein [Clostridia bacterium]|nr:DNA-binding protein [Clostridia bacterium]